MNIFVLDDDPILSTQYQVDKHSVKMVVETAQLLSAAHHILDGIKSPPNIYKLTHAKHPCTLWTIETNSNYDWLFFHFQCLLKEYTFRYDRIHKCQEMEELLKYAPNNIPMGGITEHPQCMPEQYKVSNNTVAAYRNYYIGEKHHIATWKKRSQPDWWKIPQ